MADLDDLSSSIDDFAVSESFECEVDDCNNFFPLHSTLSVITQNVRSLNCNFSDFQILLTRIGFDCDVLILTECWLSCVSSVPTINGYCAFLTASNPLQNDGVVVYIKNELSFCVEEPILQNCNCLLIKIDKNDTALLAVYRSPSYTNIDPFLESLDVTLASLSGFKSVAVVGDVNIDILSEGISAPASQYLALTAYHGLLPAHCFITRDASGTCLDHVLLRTRFPSVTIVAKSTVTDHKSVMFSLKSRQSRTYAVLTRTVIDQDGLSQDISKINFEPIYETNDCDFAVGYVINELKSALSINSKTTILPRRKRIIKPWITQGLLRCMRNRDKLHKKSKSFPDNLILKTTYIRYRNFCSSILRRVKRNYERDLVQKAGKNSKKLWDTVKNITNTAKNVNYPKELLTISDTPQNSVNEINLYFSSVGKSLAEQIALEQSGAQGHCEIPIEHNHNSVVFFDTDEDEVMGLIDSLKTECSVGWDGLSNQLLKDHKGILVPHLTYIFNLCLENGSFPKDLKKSQIRPIHKGGARDRVENFRPISILPSLSKILEKIINNRLVNYLEDKHLLSDNQFGFRRGKSTDHAVSNLTDFITTNLDKGNKCISIFLDLAKAFDTVSVPILVQKLEKIGIRGKQLSLLTDYLTNRTQRVQVGPYTSSDLPVTYGVPQGSILGPTLFLVYMNDLLCLNSFHGKIISYADDTALIFTAKSWIETFQQAQKGFDIVKRWLYDNVLTLNVEKTKYLTFSIRASPYMNLNIIAHKCSLDTTANLKCSCDSLERTETIKYLGVTIDDKFSFKAHIQALSKRIRKLTYIFKTLRHVVTPVTLKQIYYALCQSLLTYCVSSWGGAPKTTIKQLEVAQRTILKLSTFKPFRYPTTLLYEYCEVLSVRQLFILSIIMRQHAAMEYSPSLLSRRRGLPVCKRIAHLRTVFIHRFFPFLGPFVYDKINKILQIYSMNKVQVKKSVSQWLGKLPYDQTEDILAILK